MKTRSQAHLARHVLNEIDNPDARTPLVIETAHEDGDGETVVILSEGDDTMHVVRIASYHLGKRRVLGRLR